MAILASTLFALLIWASAYGASAGGPQPSRLQFTSVALKSFAPPRIRVEADCDSKFLQNLEATLRQSWEQCRSIGALEPSECQRDLFDQCLQDASEIVHRARMVCSQMGNPTVGNSSIGSLGQSAGFSSAASSNASGETATQLVIEELSRAEEALRIRGKMEESAGTSYFCINSSPAGMYRTALNGSLKANFTAQSVFRHARQERMDFLKEFRQNHAESGDRGAKLGHKEDQKAPEAAINSSAAGTTIFFPSKALPPAPLYGVQVIPHGAWRLEHEQGSKSSAEDRRLPWHLEPMKNEQKFAPGSAGPAARIETSNQKSLPRSEFTSQVGAVVPGSALLKRLSVIVDPAFTDKERATIAYSAERIPACHQEKLARLIVRRRPLGGSKRTCTQGLYFTSGTNTYVDLDPAPKGCAPGVSVETTVHEFFHVVGGYNDDELEDRYDREIFRTHPKCPVTWYGTIHYEDFAEGGTILSVPEVKPNPQPCVKQKLLKLRRLLQCQSADN